MLTAEVEKKLVSLRQKVERFQRKRLTSDFPYLFTYGTFFSIKWVFVLVVKQKLRVFYRGNIARFDLFINHDAANDSS